MMDYDSNAKSTGAHDPLAPVTGSTIEYCSNIFN